MNETQTNAAHEARNAQMSVLTAMPDFYVRNLQRTSARMLRAQERMMHGLMHAAELQMKFSQEFWASRGSNQRAEVRQEAGNAAVAETERMLAVLREITETMQRGFTEAMQLLMESSEIMAADARETGAQAAQDATRAAEAGADAARQTAQTSLTAAQDRIDETMARGAAQMREQADAAARVSAPGDGT